LKKTAVPTLAKKMRPLHIFVLPLNGYYLIYIYIYKTNCYQHQKLAGWDKPSTTATYAVKLEAVHCVLAPTIYMAYDQIEQIGHYWPTDDMAQMVMIMPCIQEKSSLNLG
jgi:uncharacterized membrane protein